MIIIGEKFNSSTQSVYRAMADRDSEWVVNMAKAQCKAGAMYLDLNTAMYEEIETMEWLIETIQSAVDVPFAFDSTDPAVIMRALEVSGANKAYESYKANKTPKPIINSVTAEKKRLDAIAPLLSEYEASIVALCMDDHKVPETAAERLRIAGGLIESLTKMGLAADDIFIDPLVLPICTDREHGLTTLETIRLVRRHFPEVHIICGLSNISYGLPGRSFINQAFLISAITAGLDSAILDVFDNQLTTLIHACKTMLGDDDTCANWLEICRSSRI